LICTDGARLPCSRGVLEAQWPWFAERLRTYTEEIRTNLKEAYDQIEQETKDAQSTEESADPDATVVNGTPLRAETREDQLPVMSPHHLILAENSEVGSAILQYFYTLNLITPLQHSPTILISLLLFAKKYDLVHLRALCTHALHIRLAAGQASPATVYEAAALGGCLALQTRALKMMMSVGCFLH
jgi:hypothetical protein